jgi:hypothetical protein
MKLYDLAGAEDDLRFSPNCWRIKMALEHKGLAAEPIPWRFVEKDQIAFSGQKAVPVLVDGTGTGSAASKTSVPFSHRGHRVISIPVSSSISSRTDFRGSLGTAFGELLRR